MTHSVPCEKASQFDCECACMGTLHGAHTLRIIVPKTASARADARVNARAELPGTPWSPPGRTTRVTSIRSSVRDRRVDLAALIFELFVAALEEDQSDAETRAIHNLAEKLSSEVAEEVEKALGSRRRPSVTKGHFWCVILASICRVYDETVEFTSDSLEDLAGRVVSKLRSHSSDRTANSHSLDIYFGRTNVRPAFVPDEIDFLEAVVKHALTSVLAAIEDTAEESVIKYVRLIACVVCPDPDAHPDVIRFCIWPLLEGPFKQYLGDRFDSQLHDWLRNAYVVEP